MFKLSTSTVYLLDNSFFEIVVLGSKCTIFEYCIYNDVISNVEFQVGSPKIDQSLCLAYSYDFKVLEFLLNVACLPFETYFWSSNFKLHNWTDAKNSARYERKEVKYIILYMNDLLRKRTFLYVCNLILVSAASCLGVVHKLR